MIRLLGRKTSGNVQKVLWLLEELGLPYEREDYGRQFGNTADDTYLNFNPTGKVPTLVDGDAVVWESNTILRYLCSRADSTLLSNEPAARAQVETWMDWQLAAINPLYMAVFRGSKETDPGPELQQHGDELGNQLAILDGALAHRPWVASATMTVADFCLGPIVHRCLGFPVTLPALAHVRTWHEKIAGMASFQAATAG